VLEDVAPDTLPDEALRGALDKALAAGSSLHLPAGLEALFEAGRGGSRRHKMSRALVVVGTICLLGLGLEASVSWSFAMRALPLRLVVSMLCFAGAFLLGGARSAWQEAVCVAVPLLGIMAITQALAEIAPERVGDRYLVVAPMIVAAFVATVPVRFLTAVVLCVAGAICSLVVFSVSAGRLGLPENWDAVLFSAGVMGIALSVARRDAISRRRSFLFALQQQLSAQDMTALNARLMRLSSTDMLTGLANRRQFEVELERAWLDRSGTNLGVALIDVDHFKLFNDSAGHAAGDACLRAIAAAVAGTLRSATDRAARYGGEEFVILMPGVTAAELPALGDRLRRAVEDQRLPHPGQPGRFVTISVGLAWSSAEDRNQPPDRLLRDADRALYTAKNAGRNRVAVADDLNMTTE
jgi:diguanylate cyclase (GGDEF)-like protein